MTPSHNKENKDWREEFDEKFGGEIDVWDGKLEEELKSFIEKVEAQTRLQVVKTNPGLTATDVEVIVKNVESQTRERVVVRALKELEKYKCGEHKRLISCLKNIK